MKSKYESLAKDIYNWCQKKGLWGDNCIYFDGKAWASWPEWHGGDYIKLLDYLEETERNYPIRIHSMNPVGVENMRRIIRRNGWTEVK